MEGWSVRLHTFEKRPQGMSSAESHLVSAKAETSDIKQEHLELRKQNLPKTVICIKLTSTRTCPKLNVDV